MKAQIAECGQLNIECEKGTSDEYALNRWLEKWDKGKSTLYGANKILINPNRKKED